MGKEDKTAAEAADQGGRTGLSNILTTPVQTKVSRGALWGCATLLLLSLLNDQGIHFSSATSGWLVLFAQTLAAYMHQEKEP